MLQQLKQDLKNDLIAGLLVIIPLATTIWLTFTIASWVIDFLTRVPKQLNPFPDLNPFLVAIGNLAVGFAAPLVFILFIGLMARNIVGRWLLDVGERLLQAIPLAGSVYKTLKQILETILRDSNNKFRRVVLVEYPRRGIWAMAFVTGTIGTATHPQLSQPMLSVIIPTTPNPTSGWYAIVPEDEVINLSISIEAAFKVLISGGIVGANVIAPAATVASALSGDGADAGETVVMPTPVVPTANGASNGNGATPATDASQAARVADRERNKPNASNGGSIEGTESTGEKDSPNPLSPLVLQQPLAQPFPPDGSPLSAMNPVANGSKSATANEASASPQSVPLPGSESLIVDPMAHTDNGDADPDAGSPGAANQL